MLYARSVGYLQFQCQSCRNLHGSTPVDWRTASVDCARCGQIWKLGILLQTTHPTPVDRTVLVGTWAGETVNEYLKVISQGTGVGRLIGKTEIQCPECSQCFVAKPTWDLGQVICPCGRQFFVRLLMYRLGSGNTNSVPLDWVVDVKQTVDLTPTAEAVGEGRGASS